jgi:sterol desaturase/sphingolipid hydroxylase (fatty acid hydroxylase superfamily)
LWGYLILSPAHHQIHHSRDPAHFNRNLGSVLAIWDWLFGTLEIPPERNPKLVFGAEYDGANPHSLYGILVTPMINSIHAFFFGLFQRLKNLSFILAQGLR